MSKATTIKEAVSKWEHRNGQKVSQTKDLKLIGLIPPIEKMESYAAISHLEKLTLSTNCIEKINNLNAFKNLKILSLGRNSIKHLTGLVQSEIVTMFTGDLHLAQLEPVAETLEELWISYNLIERLTGITPLKKLKVFYVSNNSIKDWVEFQKLTELTSLEDLLFVGNPLEEKHSVDGNWRTEVSRRLPSLKKLDGVPVIRDNDEEAVMYAKLPNKDLDLKPAGNTAAEQSAVEQID